MIRSHQHEKNQTSTTCTYADTFPCNTGYSTSNRHGNSRICNCQNLNLQQIHHPLQRKKQTAENQRDFKKVKWSSKNRRIATVSSKGKVIAKAPGRTQIIAKVGKKTYTCKVTVKVKQTSRPGIQNYVWLSATGSCYHRIPNCGRMNPNRARKISISQARNSGYSPCRKCF